MKSYSFGTKTSKIFFGYKPFDRVSGYDSEWRIDKIISLGEDVTGKDCISFWDLRGILVDNIKSWKKESK